ncbi:hypothetical protein OMO38_09465 [Chryseobacterium sp. 09-1422]|uniref:Lipocalin-like domain-containing protein n=1 Tax=Chryseobacterium kimseyorum TaxID=2984028 RepID=A0ABT3HY83_9FLAO|nr:hypothetical protein [Chryseobacterium kimseyorum]MCW3168748.1 hypothetical protein [Chryseobacterium kimseyorum]
MKRNLLLRAITSLVLLSCGEDRNEDNTQQNTISQKIIGTRIIVKKESNGISVPVLAPWENLGSFVFSSDQKLYENYSAVINNNCIVDTNSYSYSIDENGKKITTKNQQNDVLIYLILNVSDIELVLVNTEGSDTTKIYLE